MSREEQEPLARLQAVLTALLKHQLNESLGKVDEALQSWRSGELGPLETHAELLRHTARAERLGARIAQVDPESAGTVLRDAYDAELISRDEFIEMTGSVPEDVDPSPSLDADEMELPKKSEFIGELLAEGPVLLHVDARREGVAVPDRLAGDAKLVLRFGYNLSPAIADLEIDEESVSGTLTFGGVPFYCVLPWTAVYAVVSEVSQQAMVWPDDVPAEVLHQMSERAADRASRVGEPGEGDRIQEERRNSSRQPGETGQSPGTAESAGKATKRRPSHLKLVE